jgi:hypothetical protein
LPILLKIEFTNYLSKAQWFAPLGRNLKKMPAEKSSAPSCAVSSLTRVRDGWHRRRIFRDRGGLHVNRDAPANTHCSELDIASRASADARPISDRSGKAKGQETKKPGQPFPVPLSCKGVPQPVNQHYYVKSIGCEGPVEPMSDGTSPAIFAHGVARQGN